MNKNKWKYLIKHKGRDFGYTDYDKKEIMVNKGKSREAAKLDKGHWKKYGMSKKETSIINTIVHEQMHKNHPNMHEKTVMAKTKKMVEEMNKKEKQKMYNKLT